MGSNNQFQNYKSWIFTNLFREKLLFVLFWSKWLLKVAFSQKVLMHLSFPQNHKPFIFLNLKIWIFGSFKAVGASQTWPSCPYKPLRCEIWKHPSSSISMQISVTKSQIFKFRKIKDSYVWGNDKCISTFWEKNTFKRYEKRI